MSKIKATSYLNKIEAKYVNAREKWEKLQKELKEEDIRYQNIKWSNLSNQGRLEEGENHKNKKAEIYNKLAQLRKDFEESVDNIQKDSDKVFNRVFQYTSNDVDMKGVAIIQNSFMSDSELIELAESYRKSGNYTMYFMVSEKLKKDKPHIKLSESEKEANAYYEKAHRRREIREDHELYEGFKTVCLKALRDEDYLSNGIDNEHNNFYQNYRECAEGIEAEAPSPWES